MDLGYRRELDGIRGIAILAVLAYHTALFWARGARSLELGALGVDMFFVLSGFLITSLLLGEHSRSGRVSRRNFYIRRGLRLGPALLITLCLVPLILHATAAHPKLHWLMDNTVSFPKAVLAVLFFAGNWFGNRLPILGHTWSLGLEEQFYFAWPMILIFALRKRVRPQLLALGLALAAFGIGWLRFAMANPSLAGVAKYVRPYGRADGVLLGSALACVLASKAGAHVSELLRDRKLVTAMFVLVAATIVGKLHGIQSIQTVLLSVLDIGFVVLVGHVVCDPSSPFARALRTQPLAAIGRMSYGLYLLHVPLFYFAFMMMPGWTGALFAWAISLWAAAASFVLIEQPVLSLKRYFTSRTKPVALRSRRTQRRLTELRPAA